jgi:hypothetical protein
MRPGADAPKTGLGQSRRDGDVRGMYAYPRDCRPIAKLRSIGSLGPILLAQATLRLLDLSQSALIWFGSLERDFHILLCNPGLRHAWLIQILLFGPVTHHSGVRVLWRHGAPNTFNGASGSHVHIGANSLCPGLRNYRPL